MASRSSQGFRTGEWILNHRWLLVGLASLSVFIFEIIEYQPFPYGVSSNFLFEIAFYGIFLPLSTGVALSLLAASQTELAWSSYYLNLKKNLSLQLNNAQSRDELANVLLQFFRIVIPLTGATLYTLDPRERKYETTSHWSQTKRDKKPAATLKCTAEHCKLSAIKVDGKTIGLQPCLDQVTVAYTRNSSCYCILILLSGTPVAAARLYLESGNVPSNDQNRLLSELLPDIASAFKRAQLEHMMKKRNASLESEQQRIARDVHDTLGHSLAFLRLKLDQITMELDQAEMNTLMQDVEGLKDLANEAYDQMRDVLVALAPENGANPNEILSEYAEKIRKRANFTLDMQSHGFPRALQGNVQRHIYYIFLEAMSNIEKHAQAQNVEVNLRWKDDSLEIDISDDGVGFDLKQPVRTGHYGLYNMRERTLEIRGELTMTSKVGHGTCLKLQVPYEGWL